MQMDVEATSWAEALQEVAHDDSPEFPEYCAMIDSIQDRIGTSTADEFVNDFKQVWTLVEEGNMITSELRGRDKFKFMIEVAFDAKTFSSDYPELIIRLYQQNHETGEDEVKDVFEVPQYLERLERMRQLYFTGHLEGAKKHIHEKKRTGNLNSLDGYDSVNEAERIFCELGFEDPWSTFTRADVKQFKEMATKEMAKLEAEVKYLRSLSLSKSQPQVLQALVQDTPRARSADPSGTRSPTSPTGPSGTRSPSSPTRVTGDVFKSAAKIKPYTTRRRAGTDFDNKTNRTYFANRGWRPGGAINR